MKSMNPADISILEILKNIGTGSYIAGGYIRDTYLEKDWKDIDVFTHKLNLPLITERLNHRGFEIVGNSSALSEGDFISLGIKESNINLILVDYISPVNYIKTKFDIGLCKCYFDITNNKLELLDEFYKDINNKTISILMKSFTINDGYRFSKSVLDHAQRIKKKYPEYEIVFDWTDFEDNSNPVFITPF